ncbi:MAG: hypothetical protein N2115_03375 [bacterium]|nr:hypothetical protein [bacterium]
MIAFVFLLKGFSALCTQVLFLREIFIVLCGSELYFGIFFAIWLLAGAIGSFVARSIRKNLISIFFILTVLEGLCLFAGLVFIRSYQSFFNLFPGQMLSILQSILLMWLTAGVFTFLQGIRFVVGANLSQKITGKEVGPGFFYGWEAAGALSGGIIFAFVIQKYTNPFETAAIIAIINLISFLPLLFTIKKKNLSLILAWFIFLFILVSFFFVPGRGIYSKINDITLIKQWHLKNPPLYYVNTHYGNITVFKTDDQLSFIVDGRLLFTVPYPDKEWIENIVHFPLLYSEKTDNILLIGAGIKGTIPEILKYDIENIDCVEINPELVDVIKKFSPSYFPGYGNNKINIVKDDALGFLRKTDRKWDVVIVDAGIPFSLKTSRFYTEEFFNLIKQHLEQNGIFYIGIEGYPEYMSAPLADVHRVLYSTLKTVFPSIQVIPGYLTGYCATTRENIPELAYSLLSKRKKEKNIQTTVLTEFYFKDKLEEEKKEHFVKMITTINGVKNTGNRPFIVIPALKYWIFLSTGEIKNIRRTFLWITFILCFAILSLFFTPTRGENRKTKILEFTLLSTGFLSITLELILLFLFQLHHGSLYFNISILTAFFMGGITAGSVIVARIAEKYWIRLLFIWQVTQIFIILILPILTSTMAVPKTFFYLFMIMAGLLVGWEFALVNKIYLSLKEKTFSDAISRFYAVDLCGATAGSLLTPIFFVPLLGITSSLILFVFLKLTVVLSVRNLSNH